MDYVNEKEQKICELYLQGVKIADICKQCSCSTKTISKIIDWQQKDLKKL